MEGVGLVQRTSEDSTAWKLGLRQRLAGDRSFFDA